MSDKTRVLVIACGALVRELTNVLSLNGLEHIDVQCLPASYHNEPDRIPDAVAEILQTSVARYDEIFIGYADCGTGGRLDAVCERFGVERLPGAHCYEFFSGGEQFEKLQRSEPGSFYLTDFLTRHFDRLVIKALWLDTHPELLKDYFANYKRLVYLAQTDDFDLKIQAQAAADRLGLDFEICQTGYGDLEASIVILGNGIQNRSGPISTRLSK